MTKVTSFSHDGKPKESIIRHKKADKSSLVVEAEDEEDSQHNSEEEGNGDIIISGQALMLLAENKVVQVKQSVDEGLWSCIVDGEESVLELQPEDKDIVWSTNVQIEARVILTEQSKSTVKIKVNINDKVQKIAECIADLFGETKYSISLF